MYMQRKLYLYACLYFGGGGVTWRMKVALSCHKSMSPCLFTTLKKENTIIIIQKAFDILSSIYLTVILRGRAGYGLIYKTNEAVGRVGYLTALIIHQIFSLTRDWSKRVTWANIPQLKLGNIQRIQAILLISTTPRNNFFRPPKFQHKKFAISFSLFGQT